jgi:Zn-dependent protease with chaperone function
MQNSFPACASAVSSGEALTGSLTATQFSVVFEGENFRLEFPFNDLRIEADAEDREKIFFRHPRYSNWEIYTYSGEVLDDRNLLYRMNLRDQIQSLRRLREGVPKHTIAVFAVLGSIILALFICWLANDWIISYIVSQLPTQWEADLGKDIMAEKRKQVDFSTDPDRTNYVNAVAQRLVQALPKKSGPYRFYVVEDSRVNAFALPGGNVIVLDGLLNFIDTPEELAGALAHEIAHVTQRHILKRAAASIGPVFAIRYFSGRDSALSAIVATGAFMGHQRYGRANETEADEIGVDYLVKAGINPEGLIRFFRKLRGMEGSIDPDMEMFSDHPATSARIEHLEEKLRTIKHANYKPFPPMKKPEPLPEEKRAKNLFK